ncbi:hypothetical protein LINPERHAP1_LOCUS28601 [Linum perenne]
MSEPLKVFLLMLWESRKDADIGLSYLKRHLEVTKSYEGTSGHIGTKLIYVGKLALLRASR